MKEIKILILDDNKHHRSMLAKIIKPLNAEVFEEKDAFQGYCWAQKNKPDLLICDISMDECIKWCSAMKKEEQTKNIPLILMGTYESEAEIASAFASGANAYLEKKQAKSKLLKVIEKQLEQHRIKKQKLILIVDDSASMREMLVKGLSMEGYRTMEAEDGKKALAILEDSQPDLVLSDVFMPRMTGFALCEAMSSCPELSKIPFVAMSTEGYRRHMKRMMQYGAASYIVKPFKLEQLLILLEKIFSFQFQILFQEKERLALEKNLLLFSITSLVNALEARDAYTRGHSERVASTLAKLVELSGAGKSEIDTALIGGKLHDIGKIGIRDNVLLKPARLTKEEFDHIKTHPLIGTNILESITSFKAIMPIVTHHHEQFDGGGYPHGLKKEEIHLWARMTAVADTYDALTSNRPYRRGMPHEKGIEIIHDVKGTQLCPDCVDLLITLYEQNQI